MNPDQVIANLLDSLERIALALETLHEDHENLAHALQTIAQKQ